MPDPLFVTVTIEYEEPIAVVALEGRALITLTSVTDSQDPAPRTYEVRRQNGALTLVEVTA